MSRELFESDHYAWLQIGIEQAKSCDLMEVADYLEEMARGDRRELKSRLEVLIQHLLKWKYQSANRSSSWKNSIREARRQIDNLLDESPSMKSLVMPYARKQYPKAVRWAEEETMLVGEFPEELEFSEEELLKFGFYPA